MFRKRHISELESALRDENIDTRINPGKMFFSILKKYGYDDFYDENRLKVNTISKWYGQDGLLRPDICVTSCQIIDIESNILVASIHPPVDIANYSSYLKLFTEDDGSIKWRVNIFYLFISKDGVFDEKHEFHSRYNLDGKLLNV